MGQLWNVFKAFTARPIMAVIFLGAGYISACVWALAELGWWGFSNLKTTLMWVIGFAGVAVFKNIPDDEHGTYYKSLVRDLFSVTAIVTFVSEFYAFSLTIELLLTPMLFLLSLAAAFSKSKSEYVQVASAVTTLLAIAGLIVLGNSALSIYSDFVGFASTDTAREFSSPLLLSLLFLPFIFTLNICKEYESVFTCIQFQVRDPLLAKQAKLKSLLAFRFDLAGLRKWMRHIGIFMPLSTADLDASINEIRKVRRRERRPFQVPPLVGWAPDKAKSFLSATGLSTGDYHRGYDGKWWASSKYVDLDDSILPNNVAYYVYGEEFAVHRLKLVLNVNEPEKGPNAQEKFGKIAVDLLNKILERTYGLPVPAHLELASDGEPKMIRGNTVWMERKDWNGGIKNGYALMLTIDCKDLPLKREEENEIPNET